VKRIEGKRSEILGETCVLSWIYSYVDECMFCAVLCVPLLFASLVNF